MIEEPAVEETCSRDGGQEAERQKRGTGKGDTLFQDTHTQYHHHHPRSSGSDQTHPLITVPSTTFLITPTGPCHIPTCETSRINESVQLICVAQH